MPMSISEKILAAHSDPSEAKPGALIQARLDFFFANAITGPVSIRALKALPPFMREPLKAGGLVPTYAASANRTLVNPK